MRHARPVSIALAGALLFAWLAGASAQQQGPGEPRVPLPMQPAPPGPYKPIPVKLPPSAGDASFEAFRKDLGEIAKRKDRAALAGKVVAKGFFWQREDSNEADPKKSGIDNLASAVGLDAADGSGWQALASYASDPSSTAVPEIKGVICAPGAAWRSAVAMWRSLSPIMRMDSVAAWFTSHPPRRPGWAVLEAGRGVHRR